MWTSQPNSGTLVISVAVHRCFYGRLITSNLNFFLIFVVVFFHTETICTHLCMNLAILVGNPNYYIFVFALISGDGAMGVTRLTSVSVCRV